MAGADVITAGPLAGVPAAGVPGAGFLAEVTAERGRTTVSQLTVERITARLLAECPDVGGSARRVLGLPLGAAREESAVTARLHGSHAVSLAVRCSVPYPLPVGRSTEALRTLLITRVAELTGLRVQRVDIAVTALPAASDGRRVR